MNKCLFPFVLVLFSLNLTSSQNLPTVVPPSPEAASLGKFIDVPVSYYTGLPNISIPIYTIQTKGIQIPINLSYHARGVQVAQVAPRTGMGWSLSYGGSISRQTRGKGDESPNMGYLSTAINIINYSSSQSARENVENNEEFNPSYDFYPDQFSFNAGNINGKFVLDYNNEQPLIQSFGDVKISYTKETANNAFNGLINAFIIVDSQGNTYYFGKSKDGTRTGLDYQDSSGMYIYNNGNVVLDPPPSSDDRVFSSWKLMDIETSYGELISYYYDVGTVSSYYSKSYDKHSPEPGTTITNSISGYGDIQSIHTRLSQVYNYEKQLSKIEFNQGRDSIVFTSQNTLREDYDGYALDNIAIYNESNLIKKYNLNYTYTTSTDQTNLLWYFQNNSVFTKSFKRMFLSSIEEEGINGGKLPPYTFTYNSTILPSRFSTSQDYWGYYNGAPDNGPFLRMFEYGNYTPNRRVNVEKSEAGLLQEITYPTGGVTKFTYEHNVGRAPSFFSSVRTPFINPGNQSNIVLTKSDFTYNTSTGSYEPLTFVFPSTIVTYNIGCFHLRDINGNPNIPDCIFDFTMDGNLMQVGTDVDFGTCSDNTKQFNIIPKNTPGVDPDLHLDEDYDFLIIIKYVDPNESTTLYSGGKRIKKIEHITESLTTVKEFEYTDPQTGSTSGAVTGLPSFINKDNSNPSPCNTYLTTYYDSYSAYGSFQPNSIGYSHVTEYLGTKDNNQGKVEYTFTNLSDTGGDYYEFPYHPPTDNEWLRGKNIRTKFYKNLQNNNYELKKEVYNKYRYHDTIFTDDFEYSGFINLYLQFNDEGTEYDWHVNVPSTNQKTRTLFRMPLYMMKRALLVNDWAYRVYHLTGGTVNLHSTTETDYYDSDNYLKTTEYTYAYDRHYQPFETKLTDSNGDVFSSKNYYPQDIIQSVTSYPSSDLPAINALESKNRLEVIKTETKKNSNLLSTTNNLYYNNTLVLPKTIQTSKGSIALEDRIDFQSYYSNGNIQEVSKTDGVHIVYIWGYDEQYPIAKIENATFSQVSSQVSSLQNLSNADNDRTIGATGNEGALRTALNGLRNSLPNAMVNTYTYDPLIGVTSVTDAKGYTSYYEYDEFNRLVRVKDADGKILSENEYYYKNQNQP